jgi:hypothetical protein
LIIWGHKWFQLKMLSTIKLHNFSRFTTSILIVSTSETVYIIWISNLKTSHKFFYDKMISNQKKFNYKVSLHLKTYNFYFSIFPSEIVWKIQILKFKHSFEWQDDFNPKYCQLLIFITFQDLQLLCWRFFHSRSFSKFKF